MAKKDIKLSVLVSQVQKERWEKYAEEKDISLSSFVRNCTEAYIAAVEKQRKIKENNLK